MDSAARAQHRLFLHRVKNIPTGFISLSDHSGGEKARIVLVSAFE
jgi:hypothetical protein